MATKSAKKLPIGEFLEWWFNPKNGKVGNAVTVTDKKPKSPTFGKKIDIVTTGFHSVTSGCNDLVRNYYEVKEIKDFWDQCVTAKLCSTRPAKLGMMVYPYSKNSNESKVNDLKSQMGLK
jgi:hypothetical protein